MPVIKCKMCGGDLNLTEGSTVCECEYCGTKQTVPSMDNEKKLTLFSRAGRLLRACEFDKAAGVFETIVADFPEEAEAYWGLVLCKYGIEYVDDPATGKKIPTCHRSSFDSVLDDPNYEQACENTDAVARRVYRDEARAIEELRQAILQVSGKEEPYDVFISYKETDDRGERTLDSVIAQDIYKELTNEGYRVFFSRISLEDKLGTEYEPYIFAALNSAKVMLVVGTDYENFDAVWVKNEWSRFLKLIARGEKKTLIPVFKNMDAYDMPKEFAKLAAQDMGKVGAMQDLLRGVGKIVGSKKEEATQAQPVPQVVQQTVVQGGPNISAMLERGHQALEDGEWAKADEFFDQALNMDARCAEAFLGKFLAQEKAISLDAALDQRLAECDRNVKTEQKKVEENTAFRDKLAEKYVIPGYLERPVIEDKLRYNDLSYASTAASREAMQRGAMEKLNSDKLLNRAKRYAASDTVQRIYAAVKSFEQQLAARTQMAQEEEAENRQRKQATYDAFLDETEKEIVDLYEQRAAEQEQDYQEACKLKADAATIRDYEQAVTKLSSTGLVYYKDSAELVVQSQKCISGLVEQERQRKENETKAAARKKRRKIAITTAGILACIAFVIVLTTVILPKQKLNKAMGLLDAGDYEAAYALLEEIGNSDAIASSKNDRALALINSGDYEAAYALLEEIGNSDAIASSKNDRALALINSGDYEAAYALLEEIGNSDAISSSKYDRAVALIDSGDYEAAYALLEEIGNSDAIASSKYDRAVALIDSGDYEAAYALLEEIGNSDAIASSKYDRAVALIDSGDYEAALILLNNLNYKDSENQIENCYIGKFGAEKYQYIKSLQVGDTYTFGSYEQDNNTANGKEDIEWIVLDKDGMSLLLISKYGLDCQLYNTSYSSVKWESCSLRKWLNESFLNAAFSEEEQAMIPSVTVSADKNPSYSTSPGNSTTDQVFLLSITEVNKYFSSDSARQCQGTAYCYAQGALKSSEGFCWWLRSPGCNPIHAAYVHDGSVYNYGGTVYYGEAVRPALWVTLD